MAGVSGTWDTIDRYVVISTETHAGADIDDYKPYLPAGLHDDFDEWAKTYVSPFDDLIVAARVPELLGNTYFHINREGVDLRCFHRLSECFVKPACMDQAETVAEAGEGKIGINSNRSPVGGNRSRPASPEARARAGRNRLCRPSR